MGRQYCTIDDVEALMPVDIFQVGNSITDTIPPSEVNDIIELATSDMESQLSSFYAIPLSEIRLGTIDTSVAAEYPPPITYICARKAMGLIYDRYFASVAGASDASGYVQALTDDAEKQFQMILDGRRKLDGQRLIGRRFIRQTLLDTPFAPRGEGGAQK